MYARYIKNYWIFCRGHLGYLTGQVKYSSYDKALLFEAYLFRSEDPLQDVICYVEEAEYRYLTEEEFLREKALLALRQ